MKPITVKLDETTYKKLTDDRQDTSVSDYIRDLIMNHNTVSEGLLDDMVEMTTKIIDKYIDDENAGGMASELNMLFGDVLDEYDMKIVRRAVKK